ncbi:MAG: hypothetical protein MZV63_34750 [Marinilabiliales bacterium]|nr:hypothetical protein [Marinilabiliales bacterium]
MITAIALSYGVKPYSMMNADMALLADGDDDIFLRVIISERGEELVQTVYTPSSAG